MTMTSNEGPRPIYKSTHKVEEPPQIAPSAQAARATAQAPAPVVEAKKPIRVTREPLMKDRGLVTGPDDE